VPKYRDGFTEDEFVRLRAIALEMGRSGPFDAKEVLVRALESQATTNAATIDQVLIDLTDLGELRELRPARRFGSKRYELA
jgi:hypothetical protein